MAWQLWRQDDNGHRFIVGAYETREQADVRMAELMRVLHRQIYWISEADHRKAEND